MIAQGINGILFASFALTTVASADTRQHPMRGIASVYAYRGEKQPPVNGRARTD